MTTPDIASGLGTVLVETKVENQGEENAEITVSQKIYDREGTLAAEGSSDPLQTAPGEESRSGDPAHGGESGPLVRDGSRAVYGGDGDPKGTGRSWTVQRPVSDSAIILLTPTAASASTERT